MPQYAEILRRAFRCVGKAGNLDNIVATFHDLRWRVSESGPIGRVAYAVIDGNKQTGEIHILVAMEKAAAPLHEHLSGGTYGELILTFDGELDDVTGEGQPIKLLPGMHLIHEPNSRHQPKTSTFWFGYYHQPCGSKLIE